MLFHYALGAHPGTATALSLQASSPLYLETFGSIASLPVILFFFIFAKSQYQEVVRDKQIIAADEVTLAETRAENTQLTRFLRDFLTRKLLQLRTLAKHPTENQSAILGQLSLLEIEIERLLSQTRMKQRQVEQELTTQDPTSDDHQ